jgi:multidrug efflux system membrane fusion protein
MTIDSEPHDTATLRKSGSRALRIFSALIAVSLISGGLYLHRGNAAAPSEGKGQKAAAPPTPVVALPVRQGDLPVYLAGLGSVTPQKTVTVRSRVDGQLMELHYREGQVISKGSLLATIDPRPFQVQLTQAEGQMVRDSAQLQNARLDLERYQELWHEDSIPKQQYDAQEALVRQLDGTVKVDQGQIDSAKLQLDYSRITAPISGRLGLRQVDEGNIVHASDTNGLLVITQLQPISVIFPLPEDNLPLLQSRQKGGKPLTVEAWDRDQKVLLATGTLLTMDNQIDPTTGTVKLKAEFLNKANELFPNQFVNARLLVEVRRRALIVPTAAIQRGPQGTFVYLVKPDNTVALQPVTIDVSQGGEIAVAKGLSLGELVVVEGAERLREGSRVAMKKPGDKGGGGAGPRGGQ